MSNQNHNETKLPQWAQDLITLLRQENMILARELKTTRALSEVTCEPAREWFTLKGPTVLEEDLDGFKLWYFARNQPVHVCTMYKNDLIFVGRANVGYTDELVAKYEDKSDGRV